MIKLFVDDWRVAPTGWTTTRTITEAVELLSQGQVGYLSLDHDIQNFLGELPIPSEFTFSLETYATVARYVATMPSSLQPKLIFLHTANMAGAILMRNILSPCKATLIKIDSENYQDEIQRYLKDCALKRSMQNHARQFDV